MFMMVTAINLQHDLLLCATHLFGVNLICFWKVSQVFNKQNMKAVTGSAGASFQQGNPALAVKCSKHKGYSVQNSPAQAVPTFPCASIPFLGEAPWGSPQLCFGLG